MPRRVLVLHLIGAVCCFLFLSGVPIVASLALMMKENDPGGPLFLPILIIGIVFCAAVITATLATSVFVTDLLRRRHGTLPWWPPVTVFSVGAMLAGSMGGMNRPLFLLAAGGVAAVAFFIHWMVISLLSRLFRKRVPVERERKGSLWSRCPPLSLWCPD